MDSPPHRDIRVYRDFLPLPLIGPPRGHGPPRQNYPTQNNRQPLLGYRTDSSVESDPSEYVPPTVQPNQY
ncbi:unnamed protein product [Arabis nemorensis]|uniref:Uncharacterized protein n=1 Tax=Arabis nemorensis TaxID=586526 RepID=A0A565BIU8_9BRAS|nr:unnamed protein product [Arabis nemorensis]